MSLKNRLKQWFVGNRLRIKISIMATVIIFIATVPLSLYLLVRDINDAALRQWDSIQFHAVTLENEARRHNCIVNLDPSFLEGLAERGEKIIIKEDDKKIKYEQAEKPHHETPIEQYIGSALLNAFVNHPTIQTQLKKIQEAHDVKVFKNDSGELHAKLTKKFKLRNGNIVTISITRNINESLTRPAAIYIRTLPIWFAWFMIPAAAATLIGIIMVFRPLEKALTQGFKKIEESNYTEKFTITGKYGKEITHIKKKVNNILENMEYIVQQNVQNLQDISHEVNTHLTAIKQNVDITLNYGMDDKKLLKERLDAINISVQRTTEITSVILDLANLRRSSKILATPYKIVDLLDDYVNYFNKIARDITVVKKFERNDLEIFVIREHFFLALKPIMENAIKYSHPICKQIEINILEKSDFRGVSITNWGIPINNEEKLEIFSRHYRGEHGKDHAHGSGLGLSLSSEALKLYHGWADVESVPTTVKGVRVHQTTFFLWFPKK